MIGRRARAPLLLLACALPIAAPTVLFAKMGRDLNGPMRRSIAIARELEQAKQ